MFSDIHSHILWGVDDGAQSEEQSRRMLDSAYADGTRLLCLTPHYHPAYFGDTRELSRKHFEQLCAYAAATYPDLKLYLANELRYSPNCVSWLDDGFCRTLGEHHVLVDFSGAGSEKYITEAVYRLLSGGYVPILAHVERYVHFRGNLRNIRELRERGVLIQITGAALTGGAGFGAVRASRRLVREQLVDFVASDAHDLAGRKPGLGAAFGYLQKKYGTQRAEALCGKNAAGLLAELSTEKEW